MNPIPYESLIATLKAGCDYADVFFEKSSRTLIVHDDKKFESLQSGVDSGIGLRRVLGDRTDYAYTNQFQPEHLKDLARRLCAAEVQTELTLSALSPTLILPVKKDPALLGLKEKMALVEKAAEQAWKSDPRVIQVRVSYSDTFRDVTMTTSEDRLILNPATYVTLSVSVTALEKDDRQKGYHSLGGHVGLEILTEENIEETVKTAVFRALQNLKARRITGGTMPVIISSTAGGTMVHEAIGHGLEADLAMEGMSVYAGRIGEKVAHEKVTVVEDPTLPGKRGSFLFDDEGIPSQRAVLIENGILKSYLHSRQTARKMNVVSNGHGRRESYAFRPIVRMANTILSPGMDDPDSIIRSVSNGLFVKMMGGGEVNTINGDFVFEVTEGYKIENGKIGDPVRGATITGNGPDIIQTIDMVGNDIGFSIGTCGKDGQGAPVADAMPTVRIPEMVVGGE